MSNETGFPSPAQGYEAKSIDLNTLLIKNKAATYFMKYQGTDLSRSGIIPGTLLVIDRSIHPADKNLVVFAYEGEFRCGIWCEDSNPVETSSNPTAGGINPTAGGINPTAGGINPTAGGIVRVSDRGTDSSERRKNGRAKNLQKQTVSLYSGNRYIALTEDICVFGVVTYCIRSVNVQ